MKRYLEICNHRNASRDPVGSELKYDSKEVFDLFIAFVIWKNRQQMEGFSVGYYLRRFRKGIFFAKTDIKATLKLVSQEAHIR